MKRWSDANYPAMIHKYDLQDLEKAKHLCPKLYYEPRGSSEEEDFAEILLQEGAAGRGKVATMEEPFCMECESILGSAVPQQGLLEVAHDPRCRKCGFLNPHAPDVTLMTHAQVHVTELETARMVAEQQVLQAERYQSTLDGLSEGLADTRVTTEQRCEECGWNTAYYWSAQVPSSPIAPAFLYRTTREAMRAYSIGQKGESKHSC
jgi:DNA-directed RNA polymerase subunit M/transcription elongation factor TFIIS